MTQSQSLEGSHVKKIHFGCYLEFAGSNSHYSKIEWKLYNANRNHSKTDDTYGLCYLKCAEKLIRYHYSIKQFKLFKTENSTR